MKCENCQEGAVILGEQLVSRDMAIDAGDPALEGESFGVEWGQCPCCYGDWQDCKACDGDRDAIFDGAIKERAMKWEEAMPF